MQNMEYKFVELMSLQFARSPEDTVQYQITYRYNAMKVSKVALNMSFIEILYYDEGLRAWKVKKCLQAPHT